MPDGGFGFTAHVAPGGYAWWYIDALSDDGQHGLALIGFIGSVFSPYYAWARRRGRSDPFDHCAINVAVYGPRQSHWTMTERGRGALACDGASFAVGPSSFRWDGSAMTIHVDECTVPWPGRIRGTIRLHPTMLSDRVFTLDGAGQHRWRPIAPSAAIDVVLDSPAVRWSGSAYFDMNSGDTPLESAFSAWTWSRASTPQGAALLYDVERRDGSALALALAFDKGGAVEHTGELPRAALPRTSWRVPRSTRADAGVQPTVVRTLENAPFYARSIIASRLYGTPVTAVHESLSLDRFRAPLVQAMLPFRMPRRAR